jgi:Tfp pilus assembly protein PilV
LTTLALKGKDFRQRTYKKAFTFLEIMAAVVILTVALIPIVTWVPTSIQTKLKTERKTTAIFLAQGKTEELHSKIIGNFSLNYNTGPLSFNGTYQHYYYNITDNQDPDIKTISVKAWNIEDPKDAAVFYTQVAKR